MDILFIAILAYAVQYCIKKHNTGKRITSIPDFIGLLIASMVLLALVRLPIYLLWIGAKFPFNPTDTQQIVTGLAAVLFWLPMLYWQIPGKVWSFVRK